jgi:hypothetical protein
MANPNGNPKFALIRNRDTSLATDARVTKADDYAQKILVILRENVDEIVGMNRKELANWLNSEGIFNRQGRKWTRYSLIRLYKRLKQIGPP